MSMNDLFSRYRDLQSYVGWSDEDARRIRAVADRIEPEIDDLIDDFYAEILRHEEASRVLTGGAAQIARLKSSLRDWVCESLACRDDAEYVVRRWQIGLRHDEIGLNPAYVSVAMSRLRNGLTTIIAKLLRDSPEEFCSLVASLNKRLDVDLAIIQDAYQAERLKREKQAEHERSEVKFQMLVEAAACMVVILRPDHTIAYLSPYGESTTGYSAADAVSRDFIELLVPESAAQDVAEELAATLADQSTKAFEVPILCRGGTRRWFVWNARRLRHFEGGAAVLVVGHDFTQQRESQQRLLQAERLAAIGQMITGLAHESRNALQRIRSCSEMIELEVEENDEALRLLGRLQEAQDTLLRLFDEVRGYAAPIHLERTACRLDKTWREAWNLLETMHRGRDASFVEEIGDVDLVVSIDRFRMVQVFRNLLENALVAGSDPVRIHVRCRDVVFQGKPALEVRVADNGPGLSPEARENVFEPFFTTKAKGTGLGMAIARRTIDAHDGSIAVGNDRSTGAEFVITLPRSTP